MFLFRGFRVWVLPFSHNINRTLDGRVVVEYIVETWDGFLYFELAIRFCSVSSELHIHIQKQRVVLWMNSVASPWRYIIYIYNRRDPQFYYGVWCTKLPYTVSNIRGVEISTDYSVLVESSCRSSVDWASLSSYTNVLSKSCFSEIGIYIYKNVYLLWNITQSVVCFDECFYWLAIIIIIGKAILSVYSIFVVWILKSVTKDQQNKYRFVLSRSYIKTNTS